MHQRCGRDAAKPPAFGPRKNLIGTFPLLEVGQWGVTCGIWARIRVNEKMSHTSAYADMPPATADTSRPGRLQVKLMLLVAATSLPALVLFFWLGLGDRELPNPRAYVGIAVWLGALALALAVAWRLGGIWISRRAAAVSTFARQIGTGQSGARTAFKTSDDEFDQIGVAIDKMAESLKRREQALVASNQRLREEQEELRRVNQQLERRAQAGADELARAQASLRVANRDLEAISAAIGHDLRAPLRAIAGFGDRLEKESSGQLDEEGRHCITRIQAGAATMYALIEDLLNLSHITRAEMATGPVDLSKLAHEVFAELRQQRPEHPAGIIIQEKMIAIGDARLLRVMLVNLIDNALKFSAKQEVSRIEVGEHALPGDTSMFFIRDNGAGFDPAYAGKMFGIFQRLHSAKEFPGRGIGLAIVQRIIQKHGGRVSAEGAVGQGAKTCFWLRRE